MTSLHRLCGRNFVTRTMDLVLLSDTSVSDFILQTFWNEMCNDQRNAQVFNLFIYLLPPGMFRAFC
jgi:hypothetical protein